MGACYKQLNSSVGQFGTSTLQAATKGIDSTSPGDSVYAQTESDLSALDKSRDHLAIQIKDELWDAAFGHQYLVGGQAQAQTQSCESLVGYADHLAEAGPGAVPPDD